MIKKTIFPFLLITLFATAGIAQGIEFFHGSWAEAKEKAKAEEKLIFVDAYASWCGPCKRMARNVFPDPEVGAMFNENFICLKIDMEKPENAEFASKFPVSAYPTLYFIDAEETVKIKEVGAKQVKSLIDMGMRAIGAQMNLDELEEQYEAGERDPEFLFRFVRALNLSGKPSLKITNHYLLGQDDLKTRFNREFIYEGLVEIDSRVYKLLMKDRKGINELIGKEKVDARIKAASKKTIRKAHEYRSKELVTEATEKIREAFPKEGEALAAELEMDYYALARDADEYLSAAQKYHKKAAKKDPEEANKLVKKMLLNFPKESKMLDSCLKWSEDAAKASKKAEHYVTVAQIHMRLESYDKAMKAAQTGLNLAEEDSDTESLLKSMIRNLEMIQQKSRS